VKETGNQNVPKYQFWDNANATAQYKLQQQLLYEATWTDGQLKKIGGTNIALPSLTWNFSLPEVFQANVSNSDGSVSCFQETVFNITNLGAWNENKARWTSLVFVNHLPMNNTFGVKYDVIIDGYQWVNPGAVLVLETQLSDSGGDQLEVVNGTIRLGNAFFNSTTSAHIFPANTTISVNVSLGGVGIVTVYSSFPSGQSLVQDPMFGLESLAHPSGPSNPSSGPPFWVWILVALGVAVVLAVAIVLGFLYVRNKNRTYEQI